MSDYFQQNRIVSSFQTSDSWVILSPIEASIKRKIEAVGTPLKDWDISINYGIKTGLNEAFIITTEKRNEILANCADDDERKRTEELIRPILRGRDIKRYSYDWAGLWLIATFPSKQYIIEDFPSVRNHLLSFAASILEENHNYEILNSCLEEYCYKKLSQTGEPITINGKRVLDKNGNIEKSRKKTNNKWFEVQDSISYWDVFLKPRIVYCEIGPEMNACIVEPNIFINNKLYMISGSNLEYLTLFFNSNLFNKIVLRNANITGGKGVDFMDKVKCIIPSKQKAEQAISLLKNGATEFERNAFINEIFCLSIEEIEALKG